MNCNILISNFVTLLYIKYTSKNTDDWSVFTLRRRYMMSLSLTNPLLDAAKQEEFFLSRLNNSYNFIYSLHLVFLPHPFFIRQE